MLDRVTITGADDSIDPCDLAPLSGEFPFVEWAILVSGRIHPNAAPRFPSKAWRDTLASVKFSHKGSELQRPALAIHVQGRWLQSLLDGDEKPLVEGCGELWGAVQRVQLNFHGGKITVNMPMFVKALQRLDKEFIFQHDQCDGAKLMYQVLGTNVVCHALFDTSHGAGVLPDAWPVGYNLLYTGWAGGLGPENIEEQLPLIAKEACRNGNFWIDMETRVRSDNDRQFDLVKVRRVLEVTAPFINAEKGE
jgi:hypothetical protein